MDPATLSQTSQCTQLLLESIPEIASGFSSPLTLLTLSSTASALPGDVTAPNLESTSIIANQAPVLVPPQLPAHFPVASNSCAISPRSDSSLNNNTPRLIVITLHFAMSDKVYCTVTVTKGNTKPPSLGADWLCQDIGVEFIDTCEAYFLTKEIPKDKKVVKVLNCFKDFKHKQWVKINRADLLQKFWTEFADAFLSHWTKKHWDMNLSNKLHMFSQQGS
ncbi:hypothetical protein H1R20_g2853, partial [Candolleomyces eurysporus]